MYTYVFHRLIYTDGNKVNANNVSHINTCANYHSLFTLSTHSFATISFHILPSSSLPFLCLYSFFPSLFSHFTFSALSSPFSSLPLITSSSYLSSPLLCPLLPSLCLSLHLQFPSLFLPFSSLHLPIPSLPFLYLASSLNSCFGFTNFQISEKKVYPLHYIQEIHA